MKFKRILAAVLGALMITSAMSFTASVSAAEGDIIAEKVYPTQFKAERGQTSVQMYDEVNDIIFSRMTPSTDSTLAAKACYINITGQTVAPTAEQIANDSIYVVFYVRTNMTMDENDIPSLDLYDAYWGPDAIKADGTCSLVTGNENFIEQVGNDWGTMCFKLDTTKTHDFDKNAETPNTTLSINKWTHFAFLALGTGTTKPISEWFTSVDEGVTPNVDCAGYAVLSSLEAAENYDFTETAAAPKITLTFDKGLADDNSDVVTQEDVAVGKWSGAFVEFPEIEAPSADYEFIGWFTDAEYQNKIEDTTAVTVPNEDTTYYALWQDNSTPPTFALDSMTINGSDASAFGADITAETIEVKLPYGWEKLEDLGVMPEITVQATAPASAEYVAGATLADGGKIKFAQGSYTDEVDVTFTIGTASEKRNVPTEGVYSQTGIITLPDGTEINKDSKTRAAGMESEKTTLNGIEAYKHTPIYTGSEKDGVLTKDGGTEYYTSNRSVNLEGYGAFGTYDYESYPVYRALVYYDKGEDGEFDVTPNPSIYFQSNSATGTVKTSGLGDANAIMPINSYNGGRWEYIYFVKDAKTEKLYGKARQPVFSIFSRSKASAYTDDVFYCAEITALPDVPEYVQYQPTGLVATSVDGDTLGSVSGLSDDMEIMIDGEWTAVTELDGYADGVLADLEAGTYSVRYAATEVLAASEAVALEILPGSVFVTFDAQNGEEAAATEYEFDADVTIPATPVNAGYIFKGWSETKDGAVVDLTGLKATEDKTYYAIWEKIEVVYVKGAAEESGDGLSADAPFKTLAEAAAIAYNYGGTIVIMDDVAWTNKINGQNNYNYVYKDVVITSVDPVTKTDYPGALVQTGSINFDGDFSAKITIRDIEIASWRFGAASDKWQYINFRGHPIELGDNLGRRTGNVPAGYTVGQTSAVTDDDENKEVYFPIHIRAQGESNDLGYGHKIIYRDTDISSNVLAGKVEYKENTSNAAFNYYASDIDLEYYGNANTSLNVGNDSNKDSNSVLHYGKLNDVKLLFETAPKSISFNHITGILGEFQVIANNGVQINVPAFEYTNANTNEKEDLTPAGGYWKLNSAEGGRVDFTETAGTFAVTTDAEYIIVTNKATGEATRTRVSDGVSGDANLFADGAYALTLAAGEYDIAYTSEAVKIDVTFENGDNDETYTVAKGETATFAGTVTAPAGKVFAGWISEDGAVELDGNSYTADTYYANGITFVPTFEDDANAPYYYAYGEYDALNAKYIVDVKIANGKFAAGTLGVTFDKSMLTYKGYTLGEGISNNLGTEPTIVSENMFDGEDNKFVLVWDAAEGIIDASAEQVTIVTFEFDVLDAENIEDGAAYFVPGKTYEKYFNGEYYLASPENTSDNPYAVYYVPVYFGETTIKEKSYEKAKITFNVTFDSKEGATVANIGYLSLFDEEFTAPIDIKIDDADNTEATVSVTVEEFYVGETFYFILEKNGYLGAYSPEEGLVAQDGMTINITLLAGDIKDSASMISGDGKITLADFVRVVRAFDETATEDYRALVDLNEDGSVTVNDLAIVKANFNKTSEDNTIDVSLLG